MQKQICQGRNRHSLGTVQKTLFRPCEEMVSVQPQRRTWNDPTEHFRYIEYWKPNEKRIQL